MKKLLIAAIGAAIASSTAVGVAQADDTNGNHSVNVSIVNGVATVVVDGRQLYGDEAQPYIDAAEAKSKAARDSAFGPR